jgi:hypothetical protein
LIRTTPVYPPDRSTVTCVTAGVRRPRAEGTAVRAATGVHRRSPAPPAVRASRAPSSRAAPKPPLGHALVELAGGDEPPQRWVAGEDAVEGVEEKARLLLAQVDAYRSLSSDLAHDEVAATA